MTETAATQERIGTLVHRAFVYGSSEEFVTTLVAHLRNGLEREDAALVVTTPPNARAVREGLGPDATDVEFHDSSTWYANSAQALDAYLRAVDGWTSAGAGGVTVVGEPIWPASTSAQREWSRYESVLNLALAEKPVDLVCPYDARALPDFVLEQALWTHPHLAGENAVSSSSPGYVAPGSHGRALGAPARVRTRSALLLTASGDLARLRRHVERQARRAGVDRNRVADVALASSEVGSNALRHGRPPVRVRIGSEPGEFVVEVHDTGSGIEDPLAGWLAPVSDGGGWGLVLARRLADALEIRRDAGESTVRLHFTLSSVSTS